MQALTKEQQQQYLNTGIVPQAPGRSAAAPQALPAGPAMPLKLTVMLGPAALIEEAEAGLPDMPGCLFAACGIDGWDATQAVQACATVATGLEEQIAAGRQHEEPPPTEPRPERAPTVFQATPIVSGSRAERIARVLDPEAWERIDASLSQAEAMLPALIAAAVSDLA